MRGPVTRASVAAFASACLLVSAPVCAKTFDDGLAAYTRDAYEKSLKILRPLAEEGDARAQYLLGRHFQFGQAVKADRAEAYYWYRRAEAKGHLEAKLFRLLLDKHWRISAEEKARAERRLADLGRNRLPAAAKFDAKPSSDKPRAEAPAPRDRAKPTLASKPAPAKPAPSKPEPAKPEPAKPEPAKSEPAKPEIARARPPHIKPAEAAKAKVTSAKPAPEMAKAKPEAPPPAWEKAPVAAVRSPTLPESAVLEDSKSAARDEALRQPRVPRQADDSRNEPPTHPKDLAALPAETSTTLPSPSATDHDDGATRYTPPQPQPRVPQYEERPPDWRGRGYYYDPRAYAPRVYDPRAYDTRAYDPRVYDPRAYYAPRWAHRPYRGYWHPGWRRTEWPPPGYTAYRYRPYP